VINLIDKLTHILHLATGSHGYTGKTRLRGFKTFDFSWVRANDVSLSSAYRYRVWWHFLWNYPI